MVVQSVPFVSYCKYGVFGSSLVIESTNFMIVLQLCYNTFIMEMSMATLQPH